jgi:hypothetical protein
VEQASKPPTPQGPRSEPGKSVLKNAIALRRMNSEIDTATRSNRRYTHLGREASPLLPWIPSPDPSASFNDLLDFDFDALPGAAERGEASREPSALDDINLSDLDSRLDGALAGFDAEPPSTASLRSRVSLEVWEKGEKFWENQQQQPSPSPNPMKGQAEISKPKVEFTPSSPLEGNVIITPVKWAPGVWMDGKLLGMPEREGKENRLSVEEEEEEEEEEEAPSSILRTPRSLYDSEGFLNS